MQSTTHSYARQLLKNLKKLLLLHLGKVLSTFHYLRSRTLPQSLEKIPYDRPISLYIPTYEGTSQAVHPDIVPPGSSNLLYALAFTPYPFSYDQYENPSILISQNGLRFQEEQKGLNPLSPLRPSITTTILTYSMRTEVGISYTWKRCAHPTNDWSSSKAPIASGGKSLP